MRSGGWTPATGNWQVDVEYLSDRGVARAHGTLAAAEPGSFTLLAPLQPASRLPAPILRTISFRDHGRGARDGLLAGAIGGALSGFIIGASLGSTCMGDETPCAHNDKWAPIGALGALTGALILGGLSAAVGAIVGSPTTLRF